jgi:membrane-anchored protein YejM (alkaline phosphatase superfamily)
MMCVSLNTVRSEKLCARFFFFFFFWCVSWVCQMDSRCVVAAHVGLCSPLSLLRSLLPLNVPFGKTKKDFLRLAGVLDCESATNFVQQRISTKR